MKKLPSTDLFCNDKNRTRFARAMAAVESRSKYRDWRGLEAFRDRTPGQLAALRHLSPFQQVKWGKKRRTPNWITAS